jgi:hypothetical protein
MKILAYPLLVLAAAAPAQAQQAGAALPATHPLSPFAFLVGEWTGESITTTPLKPDATPERSTAKTSCELILGNAYLRCHSRFFDSGGAETWQLEQMFRKGKADPGIQARMLEAGYAGDWILYFNWDEAQRAFVATSDTEVRGQKVVERYTIVPADDRNSFLFREQTRLAPPGSPWQEVWRWTWTRRP